MVTSSLYENITEGIGSFLEVNGDTVRAVGEVFYIKLIHVNTGRNLS